MLRPGVDPSASDSTKTVTRRGLIAAAAALVTAFVGGISEETIQAGSDGDVVLGASNTTAGSTRITCTGASTAALYANGTGSYGWGLEAEGTGYAVVGFQSAGDPGTAAVYGSGRANGYGVTGYNRADPAIRGDSESSNGILGISTSGVPVLGQVAPGSNANTIAVYGLNNSTYAGSGPGAGGFGVYGLSAKGHGLVGATAAAGAAAVVGATNGVSGAYAGAFYGPVIVGGNFTVVNGAKSAAVPHPDGSHRRLYCMESPESWFEDFGKGVIECGRAEVTLDPDFAAIVQLDDYHVFLTEYGHHSDLCVAEQTPRGFRVEARNAESDGRFSWRVVARRKDIGAPRLEPVAIPAEPTLPAMPGVPPVAFPARRGASAARS
jgi:hypothetical protein